MNFSLLVTGARGQLGRDVAAAAAHAGITRIHAPGSAELDITDPAAVSSAISLAGRGSRLVVINAAAYTAVDAAEREGAARAHSVNALGPANLALACAAHPAHLVQISTDYVFAGDSAGPNTVDGPTAPRTVYGRTKLAGERAVGPGATIIRTSWVFGPGKENFFSTVHQRLRRGERVRATSDVFASVTWVEHLAARAAEIIASGERGLFNVANDGVCSPEEFAREAARLVGADPSLIEPLSDPRHAPPLAAEPPLPHWRAALAEYIIGAP